MESQPVVQFLQSLVREASVSGSEAGMTRVTADEMRRLGFDEVWQDEAGNVAGELRGGQPGAKVLFDAHMDVVPVTTPERWQRPAFSGEVAQGRVWGRGAADNKGSLAAMIHGLSALPRDQIHGTIIVVGSVGEETLEGVGLGQVVERVRPDRVVIGEPTDCRLGFAQRGRARLVFRVPGRAAHSSADDQSGNAIFEMARLVDCLKKYPVPVDEILGAGIQAPIEVISNPYPSLSTLPVECRLTVDRRLVLGETPSGLLESYRQAIRSIPSASVDLDVVTYRSAGGKSFTENDFHPAWHTPLESGFTQACLAAIRAAGLAGEAYPIPYCTNGSTSCGVMGIPAVVCGPGNIAQAHSIDEYLEIEQLLRAMQVYAEMGRQLGQNA